MIKSNRRFIIDFHVYDEDLFKRVIKDLYFNSKELGNSYGPVVLTCFINDLKVEMYIIKEWGWEVEGGFLDEYIDVRVVKLYDDYYKGALKRVWTDAINEEHLLLCYPYIYKEIDREMLTYNWEEFSSYIDSLTELKRIQRGKEWEKHLKNLPDNSHDRPLIH